ncbi:hypothetical protein BpHYR1_034153 [Brachionus plicatilis]|uniref:Uncharacterized protein n=1 Tax=Brachionus plicatilis TaxID=10195 RepID=A0A3M7S6E2_BRAPC|nr:hypothetical protein BpHYR1_034153 [Brachionus plicatilis]
MTILQTDLSYGILKLMINSKYHFNSKNAYLIIFIDSQTFSSILAHQTTLTLSYGDIIKNNINNNSKENF